MKIASFSRRSSLAFMAAAAAVGITDAAVSKRSGGAAAQAPMQPPSTAPVLNLADPAIRLATYVRIRCRLDAEPAFMPYHGTIFGKPEGHVAVPLLDVAGFSWTRAHRIEESTYRLDTSEVGYFLDRETGEVLNHWTNPMNGLKVVPKPYHSSMQVIVDRTGLKPVAPQSLPPGTQMTWNAGRPTVLNGHVWVHEDVIGRYPNRPRESFADPREFFGPVLTATSLATWSASVTDLLDRSRAFVPSMFSYQTLGSWSPFLRMGATPGLLSWSLFGAKGESIDAVPSWLRNRVLREFPDFLPRV